MKLSVGAIQTYLLQAVALETMYNRASLKHDKFDFTRRACARGTLRREQSYLLCPNALLKQLQYMVLKHLLPIEKQGGTGLLRAEEKLWWE